MANFVVRVELHDADREDYDRLHRAMEIARFSRSIVGANGIRYDLPPAKYHYPESALTGNQVHDFAKAAANSTLKLNAVVVTEANSITFSGLQPTHLAGNALTRLLG